MTSPENVFPPEPTSDLPKPPPEASVWRRFVAYVRWILDACEPVIEWTIRLCGWSAILFVFAIFFFVFREAVPALVGERASESVVSPGPNNDLEFFTQAKTRQWNGTKIVFTASDAEKPTFAHDPEQKLLAISYRPNAVTANQLAQALAEDPLAAVFGARLSRYDDGENAEDSRKKQTDPMPNSGEANFAPEADSTFKLRYGTPPLHLVTFFTSTEWRPDSELKPQYGILTLMAGTVAVTLLAMVLAVPLGLGAAVYVSEFAGSRVKETLKIVIELLAAIPSVVWGFVGMVVLNPLIITATGAPIGLNVLNGGIILALMSVPIIVSVSEDALRAVPDSYREAATALGASRWETVYRVLFPAAKNGLLAAVLLGVGRAIGETMAVLMATGHAVKMPTSLLDPCRTLTATIAAEMGDVVRGDTHYNVLFVIGVVLFAITFVVNLTADLIVKGVRGEQND